MPPLPNADKIIKVQIRGTYGPTAWANIFHMRYVGGPPDSEDLTLFDTAQGATMLRPWNHQMHVASVINSVTYTDLTSPTSASVEISKDVTGTVSDVILSANVAACINFPISRRYRGGHSRMYMAGMGNDSTSSESHWSTSFLTNMNNDFAAFIAGLNSYVGSGLATIEVGSLSYVTGGAPRVTPVFDPWVGADTQPRICTQRRRLGRGTPVG